MSEHARSRATPRSEQLPYIKLGKYVRFDPAAIRAWMTNVGCTTATFINSHFAPCYPATCMVTTFFDHYSAGDQMLVERE